MRLPLRHRDEPTDYLNSASPPPDSGSVLVWDPVQGEMWGAPTAATAVGFMFMQLVPATVWAITHNLGRPPIGLQIYDQNGDECFSDVVFVDANTVNLIFSSPVVGVARMI